MHQIVVILLIIVPLMSIPKYRAEDETCLANVSTPAAPELPSRLLLGVDRFLGFALRVELEEFEHREQCKVFGTWAAWDVDRDEAQGVMLARQRAQPLHSERKSKRRGLASGLSLLLQSEFASNGFQPISCVADEPTHDRMRRFVTNLRYNERFHPRGAGALGNDATVCAGMCGIGIFDNVVPPADLGAVLKMLRSQAMRVEKSGKVKIIVHGSRRARALSGLVGALLLPRAKALVSRHLGVPPTRLQLNTQRLDFGLRANAPCELHSDFASNPNYVFTAIIYLSNAGYDFSGGETVFVHGIGGHDGKFKRQSDSQPLAMLSGEQVFPMVAGKIVEPKAGRAVVFSSGMENLHCKMPSKSRSRNSSSHEHILPSPATASRNDFSDEKVSARFVLQYWFKCASARDEELAQAVIKNEEIAAEKARQKMLVSIVE